MRCVQKIRLLFVFLKNVYFPSRLDIIGYHTLMPTLLTIPETPVNLFGIAVSSYRDAFFIASVFAKRQSCKVLGTEKK